MSHLLLSLFGTFQATLAGEPLVNFGTDKARALLAYLMVEVDRSHRRQSLAALLWPDSTESTARINLRQTLYQLRRAVGDHDAIVPHLRVDAQEIRLNQDGDHWLDAREFDERVVACHRHHPHDRFLCDECSRHLERALELYGGDFLAGFSLPDSPTFESWQLAKQEAYHRLAIQTLFCLGDHYEASGDYAGAALCARRAIELEPWLETAYQRLIRALALDHRRDIALAEYAACCQILAREMGTEPSPETERLVALIREDRLVSPPEHGPTLTVQTTPSGAHPTKPGRHSARFVGRKPELGTLTQHLQQSLNGQGSLVFVCGEAGSGKSTLLMEFARRAAQLDENLLVAEGRSSACCGLGEPCAPFCEILNMLATGFDGGVDSSLLAPILRQRLWAARPTALSTLLDSGPDLLGNWVTPQSLALRTQLISGLDPALRKRLDALLPREDVQFAPALGDAVVVAAPRQLSTAADLARPAVARAALFNQFTCVLCDISNRWPLLVLLDDLQWADPTSCSLLFHLGCRIADSRLLVVGAYRPEDLKQDDERHPLLPVMHELERRFGGIHVDLSRTNHRFFLEDYLNSEPNQLDRAFRDTLFQHTEGHALFTVELLRDLQARGQLMQNREGSWIASPHLEWGDPPVCVKAVVAERVERLPLPARRLLEAASVQGNVFTAEVLAAVVGDAESAVIRRIADELGRQHGLVESHNLAQVGERHLSRYRFRHQLFRQHIYQSLDAGLRAQLHRATGEVLQDWRSLESALSSVSEFGTEHLAWHFEQAGAIARAVV